MQARQQKQLVHRRAPAVHGQARRAVGGGSQPVATPRSSAGAQATAANGTCRHTAYRRAVQACSHSACSSCAASSCRCIARGAERRRCPPGANPTPPRARPTACCNRPSPVRLSHSRNVSLLQSEPPAIQTLHHVHLRRGSSQRSWLEALAPAPRLAPPTSAMFMRMINRALPRQAAFCVAGGRDTERTRTARAG